MCRLNISENVKRKLYAESMGKCMNPTCQLDLFQGEGDLIEKAHLVPYCDTADNSFENMVVLCPVCHKKFDKLHLYTAEEVKNWKRIRQEELEKFFSRQYETFDELKTAVVPLLLENQAIYKNYFLGNRKDLWDKFELKILINNNKLKNIFQKNLNLIQRSTIKEYSNLECIQTFLMHVDEFEATRPDAEKYRHVLFPAEINSMFGITPVTDYMLPHTEALEALITKLHAKGNFESVVIDNDKPCIQFREYGHSTKVFLDDTPRLRQIYHNYGCFRKAGVRLQSLSFALKYLKSRNIHYHFFKYNNLREINVNGSKIIFVYEYCLSKAALMRLAPDKNSIIVNLYNWNGVCISQEAYEFAKILNVTLFTTDDFYGYVRTIK